MTYDDFDAEHLDDDGTDWWQAMSQTDLDAMSHAIAVEQFGAILAAGISKTHPSQMAGDVEDLVDGPRAPKPDMSQGSGAYGSPSAPDPARDLAEAMEQARITGRRY